jgi:hypothetical protein
MFGSMPSSNASTVIERRTVVDAAAEEVWQRVVTPTASTTNCGRS